MTKNHHSGILTEYFRPNRHGCFRLRRSLFLLLLLTVLPIATAIAQEVIPVPDFSHTRGYYTAPFDLTITVPDGHVVYYTLNGDDPTTASILYDGPVTMSSRAGDPNRYSMISGVSYEYATWAPPVGEVFKTNVLRAVIFLNDEQVGPVYTHTYFVDPGMAERYSLPVVSLVSDSLNLFDYDTGIYVLGRLHDEFRAANPDFQPTFNGGAPANYGQRGDEWERPVHVELFEPDGTAVIAQDAGVRMHGGWSRAFRQKSFRLYSRSDYGNSRFRHRIFEDQTLDNYNRLLLRNSGQDWTQTMLRDAFMQSLSRNLPFETMAYRPSVVFLNGEFWGVYNIRERYDVFYLETHYGVDPLQVDILTINRQVKEGSSQHYLDMINYISANGLAEAEHYDYIRTQMDVENFRDYYLANIYINNTDWPHNNIDYWRKQTTAYEPDAPYGNDGRWRWMMFDTDFGFGWNNPANAYQFNLLEIATDPTGSRGNNPWSTFLINSLLQNEEFRTGFYARAADLLNTNFSAERVLAKLEQTISVIEPYMQEHFDRWGYHDDRWKTPQNLGDWQTRLDLMRHFAQNRTGNVREHVKNKFSLGLNRELTIDVAAPGSGTIQVNTITIDENTPGVTGYPYPWSGTYYTGMRMQLVASPAPGYRFAGWTGRYTSDSDTLQFNFPGNSTLVANFEPDDTWAGNPENPLPHRLSSNWYTFRSWSSAQPDSTYPLNMVFLQSDIDDPMLEDEVSFLYHIPHDDYNADDLSTVGFPYNNTRRTRINGLEDGGLSFINTGRGRDLGAAVLALDTRGTSGIDVKWVGGTLQANSRTYNIRLQYRIGTGGVWKDVTRSDGEPVEYTRSAVAGHSITIGPDRLPAEADDQAYIQLRWKYYFTGSQLSETSGSRDMLRLDEIEVTASTGSSSGEQVPHNLPVTYSLETNYPNPFNPGTMIRYSLPEAGSVRLVVYNILGKEITVLTDGIRDAGRHSAWFDGAGLSSGVYIYRLEAGGHSLTGKMLLVK